MVRKYNFIFDRLVESKDDIYGHIAYSLYKYDKICFIEDYKKKHDGQEPTEKALHGFHENCCLKTRIDDYKRQAEHIMEVFSNNMLTETTKQIEEEYAKEQNKHLKKIVKDCMPSFWHGILQSILGSIFLAILIWLLIAVVGKFSIGDLQIEFKKKGMQVEQIQ